MAATVDRLVNEKFAGQPSTAGPKANNRKERLTRRKAVVALVAATTAVASEGMEAAEAQGVACVSCATDGTDNTAVGAGALHSYTTGDSNTAVGAGALQNNTTGHANVAIGLGSLYYNESGSNCTAVGNLALSDNTTGEFNTAVGGGALGHNTIGESNTAIGGAALGSNTTGWGNTAIGWGALREHTTGNFNTALGDGALSVGKSRTNTTGVGSDAQVTGDNQVQLGDAESSVYAFGAVQSRSDARDKADIRETLLGLDFIAALRPVDFRWDLRDDYRPSMPKVLGPAASESQQRASDAAMNQWRAACNLAAISHDGSHKRERFHHGLVAQGVRSVAATQGVDFGGLQDHSINGGEDVLSLGYAEFIGPIIKAIQELAAANADLHAKVELLRLRNEQLATQLTAVGGHNREQ